MKKIFTLTIGIVLSIAILKSQVPIAPPQSFSYMATIAKGGTVIANKTVTLRVSILQNNAMGIAKYVERFTAITNSTGQINIEIGHGTPLLGYFPDIAWGGDKYFLKVEVDTKAGTNYTEISVTQLLSVPYALYAGSSGTATNIIETDPTFSNSSAHSITTTNISNWNSAFNWGDHSTQGYLKSFTELDPAVKDNFDFTGANVNDLLQFNGNKWIKFTPSYASVSHTHNDATNSTSGFMSGSDKTLLTNLQNAYSSQKVAYRWATFTTYEQAVGWACNDDGSLFGGIKPSKWTDMSAQAYQMSSDKEILRTLFTQKGFASKNAMVFNNDWASFSSTNGKVVLTLFRIKNSTSSAIDWKPNFFYSAYGSWGEHASVALNGESIMDAVESGSTTLTLTIPANRVSTVIFVSTSGRPDANGSMRNCRLVFFNNSLELPDGLEFIDDLDVATGGWEQ
jgi:hypothetical protein